MILLIEDSPTDALLIESLLLDLGDIDHVSTMKEARKKCFEDYDVVVLDHFLPGGTSLDLITAETDTPIIILTGIDDDTLKDTVIKKGAFAFLSKDDIDFLPSLVDVSIRHKTNTSAKVNFYKTFYDNAPVGFYTTRLEDGYWLKVNPFLLKLLSSDSVEELRSVGTAADLYDPEQRKEILKELRLRGEVPNFELKFDLPNGESKYVIITAKYCKRGNCIEGSITDVTEKKLMEMELESYRRAEIDKLVALNEKIRRHVETMSVDKDG